jgi:DNA-binding MarR family transcriptional regulator
MGANISPLEADSRRVLDALRRIVREIRQSSTQSERKLGISGAQLFVLQHLAASPARSLNDLASRTLTHQSSVSVVVRRLIEQGLARSRPSEADGRRMEIEITAAGRAVLNRAPEPAQRRLFAALRKLPVQTRRDLAGLLEELVREMGVTQKKPTLFFEDDPEPAAPKHPRLTRRSRSNG